VLLLLCSFLQGLPQAPATSLRPLHLQPQSTRAVLAEGQLVAAPAPAAAAAVQQTSCTPLGCPQLLPQLLLTWLQHGYCQLQQQLQPGLAKPLLRLPLLLRRPGG
jgi:hypothetical protein